MGALGRMDGSQRFSDAHHETGIDEFTNPGYKHIIFKPIPGGDLSHVKSEFESIHGTIRSEWGIEGKHFTLKVKVHREHKSHRMVAGSSVAM
jgi:hypothetical protein